MTQVEAFTEEVQELAAARRSLRNGCLACLLMIPVQFVALASLQETAGDDQGSWRWDVPEVSIPRLSLMLAVAAAALGLLALVVRWLPEGREAARLEPLIGRRRQLPGGPPVGVSWPAVGAALLAFGVGGLIGEDAARGWGALAGLGERFTIGVDAEVVERTRSTRGFVIRVASTPFGRKILEGGAGHDGDAYATWPADNARAWRLGVGGIAVAVLVSFLSLLALGLGWLGARWQWRRALAFRRWKDARGDRWQRSGRVLALRVTAIAAVLAAGGAVLAAQISRYDAEAHVTVPGLASIGAPGRLRVRDWFDVAPRSSSLPEPERSRRATPESRWLYDSKLDVEVAVQRYREAGAAMARRQRHQLVVSLRELTAGQKDRSRPASRPIQAH